MKCEDVLREVSNYVDRKVEVSLRRRMDRHVAQCKRCKAVLEGTRNIVRLVSDPRAFEVPDGFSSRLYSKLEQHLDATSSDNTHVIQQIPVGITDEQVPLGSHLIYFWESDEDFERGVRFLDPGLGKGDHCIVFGHDEAIARVMQVIRSHGFDPDELIRSLKLTILRRHASAEVTLSDIADVALAAVRAGARAIRFLGNLGMGRDPLPAGEEDVIKLESAVTNLLTQFPGVVVCMYDVRTLPGRLILNGGLKTHELAICSEGVRKNPYFEPDIPAGIHVIQ